MYIHTHTMTHRHEDNELTIQSIGVLGSRVFVCVCTKVFNVLVRQVLDGDLFAVMRLEGSLHEKQVLSKIALATLATFNIIFWLTSVGWFDHLFRDTLKLSLKLFFEELVTRASPLCRVLDLPELKLVHS